MVKQLAAFFALVLGCAALLGGTAALTGERVEANRQRQFLDAVSDLTDARGALPPVQWTDDVWPLCDGTLLARGAAPGYAGPIRWLAAVRASGAVARLGGVQVTAHQETPGIVDFLTRDHPWLAQLRGRNAAALRATDAVSGATITSRAVLADLARALEQPQLRNAPRPEPEDCAA